LNQQRYIEAVKLAKSNKLDEAVKMIFLIDYFALISRKAKDSYEMNRLFDKCDYTIDPILALIEEAKQIEMAHIESISSTTITEGIFDYTRIGNATVPIVSA
jgi:hypothetical protein